MTAVVLSENFVHLLARLIRESCNVSGLLHPVQGKFIFIQIMGQALAVSLAPRFSFSADYIFYAHKSQVQSAWLLMKPSPF